MTFKFTFIFGGIGLVLIALAAFLRSLVLEHINLAGAVVEFGVYGVSFFIIVVYALMLLRRQMIEPIRTIIEQMQTLTSGDGDLSDV